MRAPLPYGLFVIGGQATGDDLAHADALAREVTNMRTAGALVAHRMRRPLPDGGEVEAVYAGGTFRVYISKDDTPDEKREESEVSLDVPLLFSGVVTRALVRSGEGVEMRITMGSRRRIAGYGGSDAYPPERVELQRFRIGYHTMVQEFEPKDPGIFAHTQYVQQRPGWYSGAMAEVMQIVGGYGRQDFDKLPRTPVEQARYRLPEEVRRKIAERLQGRMAPGYTGAPPKDGKFQFDYKHHNTHGVLFGADKTPWLLQVDRRGVWAMPLPLAPATTTPEFRTHIEAVGDEEVEVVLDRFGGMPSGEGFPREAEAFEAWRRAGVIVKLGSTSEFYRHIAYTIACGWSFNSAGTEGFNTCYSYDDKGIARGLAFKMRASIGALPERGYLPPTPPVKGVERERGQVYLAQLLGALSYTPQHNAIRYKLRRADEGQIMDRARRQKFVVEEEVAHWDALEMTPIASGSANVVKVGDGALYHPAKFKFQPQIKFPDPAQGACMSFDFTPAEPVAKDERPRCDTTMFGYYVGDELRVIKYFYDPRQFDIDSVDDFDACMTVGAWTKQEFRGGATLAGHFYSSDWDEREELPNELKTTNIVGKDLGYDHTPWFEFDAPFWKPGTMWRNRYLSHHTMTSTGTQRSIDLAVCVPYLTRNAALFAERRRETEVTTESLERLSVRDPYSYRYWTYDFVMHWAGGLEVMRGVPYPVNGSPVWVEIENYDPGPCSDFADNGPWIPGLPADYTWLVHPQANVWHLSGGGGAPPLQGYSMITQPEPKERGALSLSMRADFTQVHRHIPDTLYFLSSPTEFGNLFYRDAVRVAFGRAEYTNVSEQDGDGPDAPRRRWGFTRLADHKSAHHFIGVIHE